MRTKTIIALIALVGCARSEEATTPQTQNPRPPSIWYETSGVPGVFSTRCCRTPSGWIMVVTQQGLVKGVVPVPDKDHRWLPRGS